MMPIVTAPTGDGMDSKLGSEKRGIAAERGASMIEHRIVTGVDIAVAWTTALFLLVGTTLLPVLG